MRWLNDSTYFFSILWFPMKAVVLNLFCVGSRFNIFYTWSRLTKNCSYFLHTKSAKLVKSEKLPRLFYYKTNYPAPVNLHYKLSEFRTKKGGGVLPWRRQTCSLRFPTSLKAWQTSSDPWVVYKFHFPSLNLVYFIVMWHIPPAFQSCFWCQPPFIQIYIFLQ